MNDFSIFVTAPVDAQKHALELTDEILKGAAIVVAGLWTFQNYVRGRTHRRRNEITVTGELRQHEGKMVFFGDCCVKNIGLSKAPIKKFESSISVYALRLAIYTDGNPRISSDQILVRDFLEKDGWNEPGESMNAPFLVPVPDSSQPLLGIKVDIIVTDGKLTWDGSKIFESQIPNNTEEANDGPA